MKELVIISGKGGTGKTSITASFATLAENAVLADCDVDAADLHLILQPAVKKTTNFSGGSRAAINPSQCKRCGQCLSRCRFDAISADANGTLTVNPIACEGCGVCAWFCRAKAIDFGPVVNGQWFESATRAGSMVHAKLGVGEENSGKLVSTVRQRAKQLAEETAAELVIIDGSPGIGCPVVASITGADMVMVVTEPTLSGMHDLQRVARLTKHFNIKTMVCINKWDLNEEIAAKIEADAKDKGLLFGGRIRYDRAVTEAQIESKSIVEYQQHGIAQDIRNLWSRVYDEISQ